MLSTLLLVGASAKCIGWILCRGWERGKTKTLLLLRCEILSWLFLNNSNFSCFFFHIIEFLHHLSDYKIWNFLGFLSNCQFSQRCKICHKVLNILSSTKMHKTIVQFQRTQITKELNWGTFITLMRHMIEKHFSIINNLIMSKNRSP